MNRRDESRAAADRKRERAQHWRRWYRTKRWREKRGRWLKVHPFCVKCADQGKTRPATKCDHVIPHKGDPLLFWYGEIQGLCESCHNKAKQLEEIEGFSRDVGGDGWPIDPRHPFNQASKDKR